MNKTEFDKLVADAQKFLKENKFVISDTNLRAILSSKIKGYPILLVGPTGCGKTQLLSLLSKFWKGTYEYQSLNGSVTIHDLTQERILGKNGEFIEHDMVLARWLRNSLKGISILHFDEVNAARPETLLALHPILDIKGELVLPYTDEVLKMNENAIIVMSCNEGDEYIGVNAMNVAFQNRYIKIHLPYIQGGELAQMLSDKTHVPYDDCFSIVKVWEKYMTSKEPDQPVVSIRLLERWCELSDLLGLREAGRITFASLISKNEEEMETFIQGDLFVHLKN